MNELLQYKFDTKIIVQLSFLRTTCEVRCVCVKLLTLESSQLEDMADCRSISNSDLILSVYFLCVITFVAGS